MFLQILTTLVIVFFTSRWFLRKLKVRSYGNKYVLVTGCDSGFGNMLAKRLDKLGFRVFAACLTDQSVKDLKETCSNRLVTVELDVTKETSIDSTRQFVEKQLPKDKGLWAVVNNAGVSGVTVPLEWMTPEDFRSVIEVNLFGVVFVTKAFLSLVRKEKGRIVNMASIIGRIGIADSHYATSKFGVEGFSDQLRRELYHTGVSVHIIEPGFFRTSLLNEERNALAIQARFDEASEEVQRFYGESYRDAVCKNVSRVWRTVTSPNIHWVVNAYEHAITARFPKARYVVGWDANIFFRLLWNLPEWLADYIVTRDTPRAEGIQL